MAVEVIPGSPFQPDVTLSYKGQTILELETSAVRNIKLSGKYCEDDIVLNYTKRGSREDAETYFDVTTFLDTQDTGGIAFQREYWLRSPAKSTTEFVFVDGRSAPASYYANNANSTSVIAPFGCI